MKTSLSRIFLLGATALMLQSSSANAQVVTTVATGLAFPFSILVGKNDTVYVANYETHDIKKIDPMGTVTPFVGSGISGSADGTGAAASFTSITGMVFDAAYNIYALDHLSSSIRKITPAGVVTTFVSSGLNKPGGIVWGKDDTLIVYNNGGGKINKIAASGAIVPFTSAAGSCGGLAKGSNDTMYLAGNSTNKIYKIDPLGTITTLAGSGAIGSADATGTAATFWLPTNIILDGAGDLYVTCGGNNKIRKVTRAGVVTTIAGNGTGASTDGTGTSAQFFNPYCIDISPTTGNFYIADYASGAIRKMTGGVPLKLNKYTPAATVLKVYPSPFTEGFSISSSKAQSAQIMNTLGQVLQTINIVAGEQQISMAGQPAGIYYIKTENGAAQQIVKL